jgi:hypothetical protein
LAGGGQEERRAQFILVEGDVPGRREIAGVVGGNGPGHVRQAGVVVPVFEGMEHLALDRFARGEAGSGNEHGAAGRIIGLIGGDRLRQSGWRN